MRFNKILGAATLAVAIAVAGSAHAVGTAATATDLPFGEQARTLGLSDTQAGELQEKVTTYLDRLGGKQVAINEIDLDHGGFVLVTLPGETYARDLDNPSVRDLSDCRAGYLCAFSGNNFTGTVVGISSCATHLDSRGGTQGSYANKLSSGTRGTFVIKDGSGGVRRSFTPPAPSQSSTWNWSNTHAVWACQMG
jgi:Peptidase inhibitor family I36